MTPDPNARRPFFLALLACGLLTLAVGLVSQTAAGRTRHPDPAGSAAVDAQRR